MLINKASLSETVDAINAAYFDGRTLAKGIVLFTGERIASAALERAAAAAVPSARYARRRHALAVRTLNNL